MFDSVSSERARRALRYRAPSAVAALAVGLAAALPAGPAPSRVELNLSTHVYRRVEGVDVALDVHRSGTEGARPVVVWIHGGALILGSRRGVPRELLQLARERDYAVASLDYRLAPEVKLPAIVEDMEAAFRWIRGPEGKAAGLDASRLAVVGGSAGGYLTLMSGLRVQPRPRALVSLWGYGDVDGEWYTRPSVFYRTQTPLVPEERARSAVGRRVLTSTGADPDEQAARAAYYRFLRQNGLWTREVTGFDPETERARLDPFCPVRSLPADYPPTMLVHGTEDTDVPCSLSADMDQELTRRGIPHELVTVPGAGHGLSGLTPEKARQVYTRATEFIRRHLERD